MQTSLDQNHRLCLAWKTEKNEGPFKCPECNRPTILKKGKVKEHHFAHVPPFSCHYGSGESQVHYKCKREIYEALLKNNRCVSCEIEKRLNGVRPDVFASISGAPIAIEVQKSDISTDEIVRRTSIYKNLGIFVLWLIPAKQPKLLWRDEDDIHVCRPKEWEKYLHSMYLGRVYYWHSDLLVTPYHFEKYQTYVDSREWYDSYGDQHSAGGYLKDSKVYKLPIMYPDEFLDIVDDFRPNNRKPFGSGRWYVPPCSIWSDTERVWWKKT